MDHAASGGQTDKAEGAPFLVQKKQMKKAALADSQRSTCKARIRMQQRLKADETDLFLRWKSR
jgi:hypothetical protein